jgi:hypothetical protein
MTVVGVVAGQLTVEQAMVATLERWLPEYVVAAARRYAAAGTFGINTPAMELLLKGYAELLADPSGAHSGLPFKPRGITVAKSFEDWPVHALPHVQVLSPSWTPNGGSQNGRSFKYQIQVACLVGAQQHDDTRLIRACYEDAILGAVTQHSGLGGVAAGVDLVGGGGAQFNEMAEADSETFQGALTVFEVTLENVLDTTAGPSVPIEPVEGVPPQWPANPTLDEDATTATLVPSALGDPL